MPKTDYPRLYKKMSAHPRLLAVLNGAQLPMTALVAIAYLYYVVLTVIFSDIPGIITALVVSGVPFVVVSLIRSRMGGKRPYEVYVSKRAAFLPSRRMVRRSESIYTSSSL